MKPLILVSILFATGCGVRGNPQPLFGSELYPSSLRRRDYELPTPPSPTPTATDQVPASTPGPKVSPLPTPSPKPTRKGR